MELAKPLPRLTPEIWNRVFWFCKEERTGSGDEYLPQSALATLMRVNSMFYHAAAPHLYEKVSVRNLISFFLGATPPTSTPLDLPSALQSTSPIPYRSFYDHRPGLRPFFLMSHAPSPSCAASRSAGIKPICTNRKNHLLKYVKSLETQLGYNTEISKSEDGGTDVDFETAKAERSSWRFSALLRHMDRLCEKEEDLDLYNLPPTLKKPYTGWEKDQEEFFETKSEKPLLLPNLKYIHIGPWNQSPHHHHHTLPDWSIYEPRRFAPLLAKLSNPSTTWCESHNAGLLGYIIPIRPNDITEFNFPETYIMHAQPDDAFALLWGTKNIVYIDQNSDYYNYTTEEEDLEFDLFEFIQSAISSARPQIMKGETPTTKRAKERTELIIYGIVKPIVEKMDFEHNTLRRLFGDDVSDDEEDDSEVIAKEKAKKLMGRLESAVKYWLTGRGTEAEMNWDKVSLRMPWEAEPCPCCGRDCFYVPPE